MGCDKTSIGKIPLIDGVGLYKNGNLPPPDHLAKGVELGNRVEKLDTNGIPNTGGKLVIAFVGMSNFNREVARFIKLNTETYGRNRSKTWFNGCRGAWDLRRMVDSADEYWIWFHAGLVKRNISPKQVQVLFLKNSVARQTKSYPDDVAEYIVLLEKQITRVKQELPNLKQIYISSAIYSGYAIAGGPRHEPGAYYEGLAVKEVVDRHVGTLPWIAFGPYLWADGVVPRSDGLTWICPNDYQTDLTHPSDLGTLKVAKIMLKFMQTFPATTWFAP